MIRGISLSLGIVLLWVLDSEATDIRFPEMAGWKPSGKIQKHVAEVRDAIARAAKAGWGLSG